MHADAAVVARRASVYVYRVYAWRARERSPAHTQDVSKNNGSTMDEALAQEGYGAAMRSQFNLEDEYIQLNHGSVRLCQSLWSLAVSRCLSLCLPLFLSLPLCHAIAADAAER
jgi:hypothetical protein